jgi:hypothetical protein
LFVFLLKLASTLRVKIALKGLKKGFLTGIRQKIVKIGKKVKKIQKIACKSYTGSYNYI